MDTEYLRAAAAIFSIIGTACAVYPVLRPSQTTLEVWDENRVPVKTIKVLLLDGGLPTEPPLIENSTGVKQWVIFRRDVGATLSIRDSVTGGELHRMVVERISRAPISISITRSDLHK